MIPNQSRPKFEKKGSCQKLHMPCTAGPELAPCIALPIGNYGTQLKTRKTRVHDSNPSRPKIEKNGSCQKLLGLGTMHSGFVCRSVSNRNCCARSKFWAVQSSTNMGHAKNCTYRALQAWNLLLAKQLELEKQVF